MSDLSNDLLLQIHSQQTEMAEALGRIEGDLTARVKGLETDATRNWWVTAAITPFMALLHWTARKSGITV